MLGKHKETIKKPQKHVFFVKKKKVQNTLRKSKENTQKQLGKRREPVENVGKI